MFFLTSRFGRYQLLRKEKADHPSISPSLLEQKVIPHSIPALIGINAFSTIMNNALEVTLDEVRSTP